MSFVTDALPLPVSVIEMVSRVIDYVKSALVVICGTSLKSRLIACDSNIAQHTQLNTVGAKEAEAQ